MAYKWQPVSYWRHQYGVVQLHVTVAGIHIMSEPIQETSPWESLYEAALALEVASERFKQQGRPKSDAGPALGRHVRRAEPDEIKILKTSSTSCSSHDPSEATMDELLSVLRKERSDVALELTDRWEHANLEFQSLYEQCPELNEQFVADSVQQKLEECTLEFETEIEFLKEQITFLDHKLRSNATSLVNDQQLQQKLETVQREIEQEEQKLCEFGTKVSDLKSENSRLEKQLCQARDLQINTERTDLADIAGQIDMASLRLKELERTGQCKHLENIRNAVREAVRERSEKQEPFAVALSILYEHNGLLDRDEFKSKIAGRIKNGHEAISILYELVGQGLIEIDRASGNGVVKSCINLI